MTSISVIIPVYNVAPYIIRCLESVLAQTYKDYEVILVDDRGTDNSRALAQAFISERRLEGWRIVRHEKNRGLSAARNTGIDMACGRYLYFLDSDDAITPECLSLLAAHVGTGADLIMAKYDNIPQETTFPHFGDGVVGKLELIQKYEREELPWNAVNKLLSKDFITKNALYFCEGILSEDLLWNFFVLKHVHSACLVNRTTYHYYMNAGSIMHSVNTKYATDLLQIDRKMKELTESGVPEELIRYYLKIRYKFLPEAILWKPYSFSFQIKILSKLFKNRTAAYNRLLPRKKRLLLRLSPRATALFYYLAFWYKEFSPIIRKKLHIPHATHA